MPRGPLPAEIYWRRRLLVLAVLLLLVWLVVTVWPDGGDEQPTSRTTASATPAAATPESGDDGTEVVSLSSSATECDPAQVRMTPSVVSGQSLGSDISMSIAVSTTSAKPCTVSSAGDTVMVVSTGSAGSAVWDSSVCASPLIDRPVLVSAGWSTIVPVSWSGRRSGGGCSPQEPRVAAGDYQVEVGLIGGEPGTATFSVVSAPTPKPRPSQTTSAAPSSAAPQSPSASSSPSASPGAD